MALVHGVLGVFLVLVESIYLDGLGSLGEQLLLLGKTKAALDVAVVVSVLVSDKYATDATQNAHLTNNLAVGACHHNSFVWLVTGN